MGSYTKSILEREKYAKKLEKEAEIALCNTKDKTVTKDPLETVYEALKYVLKIFSFSYTYSSQHSRSFSSLKSSD